jgi:hypothetical protein
MQNLIDSLPGDFKRGFVWGAVCALLAWGLIDKTFDAAQTPPTAKKEIRAYKHDQQINRFSQGRW